MQAHPLHLTTGAEDVDLAYEFAPAPWLLPPRTTLFPYAGLFNDLMELARVQAATAACTPPSVAGEENTADMRNTTFPAITLFLFTKPMSTLTQNAIYTLVKFARASNFMVMAPSPEDLMECLNLNLPW